MAALCIYKRPQDQKLQANRYQESFGVLWNLGADNCKLVLLSGPLSGTPCARTHAHAKQECSIMAAEVMQYIHLCNRHMHCMLTRSSCLNEAKHETVGT